MQAIVCAFVVVARKCKSWRRELANDADPFTLDPVDPRTCFYLRENNKTYRFAPTVFVDWMIQEKSFFNPLTKEVLLDEDLDRLFDLAKKEKRYEIESLTEERERIEEMWENGDELKIQADVIEENLRVAFADATRACFDGQFQSLNLALERFGEYVENGNELGLDMAQNFVNWAIDTDMLFKKQRKGATKELFHIMSNMLGKITHVRLQSKQPYTRYTPYLRVERKFLCP